MQWSNYVRIDGSYQWLVSSPNLRKLEKQQMQIGILHACFKYNEH